MFDPAGSSNCLALEGTDCFHVSQLRFISFVLCLMDYHSNLRQTSTYCCMLVEQVLMIMHIFFYLYHAFYCLNTFFIFIKGVLFWQALTIFLTNRFLIVSKVGRWYLLTLFAYVLNAFALYTERSSQIKPQLV